MKIVWFDEEKLSGIHLTDMLHSHIGRVFLVAMITYWLLYFLVDAHLGLPVVFQFHYPPELIALFLAGVGFFRLGLRKVVYPLVLSHYLLWVIFLPSFWVFLDYLLLFTAFHLVVLAGYFWRR